LPDQTTDFIFAVLGETFGFLGCLLVVGLFVLLLYRLWKISKNAKDKFGSYFVFGVICMIFLQAFVNIGMTMGLVPVTGITLPFISYGGSSMLANMIAIGIALNISMHRDTSIFKA
ncbi:MAG TPA: FtsW/RodA/SpoVE family cell cycle protein, partial [Clostridia bacterium]|nr:FtsW/RodA/SpoVE family cell cycle protein [Clostridia bacterium]